jgi:xanthine/CO dehydrogenase XdhC/CoxF family maturation factor
VAAIVFDAGGLIALDRGDREVGALLAVAADGGVEAVTSSACVAQAWRDPARQARLARALTGFVERSLDPPAARDCGRLLARARTSDLADAAIALLVEDGDTVLTSDSDDIGHLLDASGRRARIRRV